MSKCKHTRLHDSGECADCGYDPEGTDVVSGSTIARAYNEESGQMEWVEPDTTINNGGITGYYQLSSAPFPINDFDDFAEWRGLNGYQFNIGKVAWTFNVGRHSGTDQIRDLNKVIHYAEREKQRLIRQIDTKEQL